MTKIGRLTGFVSRETKKTGSAFSADPGASKSWLRGNYWMALAPVGVALSLPPEPIELVACQIVPVVFVKK